jgi:hypothetical protein
MPYYHGIFSAFCFSFSTVRHRRSIVSGGAPFDQMPGLSARSMVYTKNIVYYPTFLSLVRFKVVEKMALHILAEW